MAAIFPQPKTNSHLQHLLLDLYLPLEAVYLPVPEVPPGGRASVWHRGPSSGHPGAVPPQPGHRHHRVLVAEEYLLGVLELLLDRDGRRRAARLSRGEWGAAAVAAFNSAPAPAP